MRAKSGVRLLVAHGFYVVDSVASMPRPVTDHGHQGNTLEILRDCVLFTRFGETAEHSTRFHAIRRTPTNPAPMDAFTSYHPPCGSAPMRSHIIVALALPGLWRLGRGAGVIGSTRPASAIVTQCCISRTRAYEIYWYGWLFGYVVHDIIASLKPECRVIGWLLEFCPLPPSSFFASMVNTEGLLSLNPSSTQHALPTLDLNRIKQWPLHDQGVCDSRVVSQR